MKKALAPMTRFVLVGLLTAACQDDGMVIAEQIAPEPTASASMMTPIDETSLEKAAVQGLLLNGCGTCHGDTASRPPHSLAGASSGSGQDPIADIGDIDALVDSGVIQPGLPEESPLWRAMDSGQMPPVTSGLPPLRAEDLRRVRKFIVRLDPPSQLEAIDILLRNCGICHDRQAADRAVIPIDDIADVGVLVAAGLIVPGDRERSQLYTLVLEGDMPPRSSGLPPVSERDRARLGGFIDLLSEAQPLRAESVQPKAP